MDMNALRDAIAIAMVGWLIVVSISICPDFC
jgi:hypothetical protein